MNVPPDPDLEDLVAECAESIDRDGPAALERLCSEHPQHAAGLRSAIAPLLAYGVTGAREPLRPAPPPAAPMPERLGEFVIQREIGRGGMGVVYEALQPALRRRVAIKVLPAGHFADARQVARFQNEARAAATLDHPNIVPVHYVGQTDGHHWYAMHLVQGTSLRRLLAWLGGGPDDGEAAAVAARLLGTAVAARPEPLPPGWFHTAADLARQAAEALAKAHAVGILHRDVKPGNLLVEGSGHLWVADFGLAHFQLEDSDLTHSGEFVGTLAYSSPERLSTHTAADARSDVYSLGAALYELLALRPPFAGPTPQLMRQVLEVDPAPLRQRDPRIPVDLDTIVRTAMSKEPTRRYQSAGAFAADLRAFLAGRPIAARPVPRWQRAQRWCRRNPAIAASAGIAIALAAVLAVVAFVTVRTARERDRAVQAEAAVTALSNRRTFDARVEAVRARRLDPRAGRRDEGRRLLAEARDTIGGATADPDQRAALRMRLCTEAIANACLWDAGEEGLLAPDPAQRPLAFDGTQTHAAVAAPGELRVVDGAAATVARLAGFRTVQAVRFCRDDAWVSFLADGLPLLWHWSSGRTIRVPAQRSAPHLCSSRDRVFVFADDELVAIDLATGAIAPALPPPLRQPWPMDEVGAMQCSADGRWLALARRGHAALAVYDTGATTTRRDVALPDDAWCIAFDGAGGHALVAGRFLDLLRVDLLQGAIDARFHGHHAEVTALACSRDGALVASFGWDSQLLLWNAQGQRLVSLPTPEQVPELSFTDDARTVGWSPATGDRHGARRWRLLPPTALHVIDLPDRAHTGKPELVQHPDLPLFALENRDGITFLAAGTFTPIGSLPTPAAPLDIAFRQDGALVVGYGEVAAPQVWPVHRGDDGVVTVGPPAFAGSKPLAHLALHGAAMVACDGVSLSVLDVDGGVDRTFAAAVPSAADLSLSPDGRYAAVGVFPDGAEAVVFDLATGARVFAAPACEARAFASFSPDGTRAVFARRDAFWVHEVGTWRQLGVLARPHVAALPGHCAWSADGRLLVVPIEPERLRVLEARTLTPLFELEVPDGAPAGEPVFAADGRTLLLPSIHRTLFAWDLGAIARELADLDLSWPGAPTGPGPEPAPPLRLELRR